MLEVLVVQCERQRYYRIVPGCGWSPERIAVDGKPFMDVSTKVQQANGWYTLEVAEPQAWQRIIKTETDVIYKRSQLAPSWLTLPDVITAEEARRFRDEETDTWQVIYDNYLREATVEVSYEDLDVHLMMFDADVPPTAVNFRWTGRAPWSWKLPDAIAWAGPCDAGLGQFADHLKARILAHPKAHSLIDKVYALESQAKLSVYFRSGKHDEYFLDVLHGDNLAELKAAVNKKLDDIVAAVFREADTTVCPLCDGHGAVPSSKALPVLDWQRVARLVDVARVSTRAQKALTALRKIDDLCRRNMSNE